MLVICADLLLSQQTGTTWMCSVSALQFPCLLVYLEKKEGGFLFEYGSSKIKVSVTTVRFLSSWRFRWHLKVLTPALLPGMPPTLPACPSSHFPIPHPHPHSHLPSWAQVVIPSHVYQSPSPLPSQIHTSPTSGGGYSTSLQIKTLSLQLHRKIGISKWKRYQNWWRSG